MGSDVSEFDSVASDAERPASELESGLVGAGGVGGVGDTGTLTGWDAGGSRRAATDGGSKWRGRFSTLRTDRASWWFR